MKYIATLPMYDWPEARDQTLELGGEIIENLSEFDVELVFPKTGKEVQKLWRAPNLIFSQTCWGPLSNGLIEHLDILAQPDYSTYLGGRGQFYRSAIVARNSAQIAGVDIPPSAGALLPSDYFPDLRFAYNERGSLSGFIAVQEDLSAALEYSFSQIVESGSHRHSIQLIASGEADIAAIDCRSWDLALAHEDTAKDLKVVGWTKERLGLPYVCSKMLPEDVKSAVKQAMISAAEIS